MRVISGCMRGKKLHALKGLETRPTIDRVKEALFNVIQFDVEEKNVLDLFAGNGSLGIEALSRGAKKTVFCDNSNDAIKIINRNLDETGFHNKAQVIKSDYLLALKKLNKDKFDLIFLDPPYESNYIVKAINEIMHLKILSDNGIIIIETNRKEVIDDIREIKAIELYDERKYGNIMLIFVRKDGE